MRRAAAVVLVTWLLGAMVPAAPASAALARRLNHWSGDIQCDMYVPTWPNTAGLATACFSPTPGVGEYNDAAGSHPFTTNYVLMDFRPYRTLACLAVPETADGVGVIDAFGRDLSTGDSVHVSAPFTWTQVGTHAVVTTGPATFNGEAGSGLGTVTAMTIVLETPPPTTCASPGTQTFLIQGPLELTG